MIVFLLQHTEQVNPQKQMIPSERDKPAGLELSDFLPVSIVNLKFALSFLARQIKMMIMQGFEFEMWDEWTWSSHFNAI